MRSLAKSHDLHVLSFNASDEFARASLEATRSYCKEVVTFPDMDFPDERRKRSLQLRSLVSRHSYEHLLLARRREFAASLRSFVASGGFDIVQIEFAQMAAFRFPMPADRRWRATLDEHNIEFDIVRRTAGGATSPVRRLYSEVDYRKLAREERGAWRRLDGVTLTSERDAGILRSLEPSTRLAVVPNGVDIDHFTPSEAPPTPDNLLFFGAMNYYPNQEGIAYFLEQIFPLILRRRPHTKLWIVGPGADHLYKHRGPNIEVTGFVDAVEPYIDQASAVVVPLRLGGGTRLKIVEAMAKGKAIVSTTVGAEGIDVVNDQSAILADDPQEFASQVERVLADPPLARRLGAAARDLAVSRYSWSALAKGLEEFYEQLLRLPAR